MIYYAPDGAPQQTVLETMNISPLCGENLYPRPFSKKGERSILIQCYYFARSTIFLISALAWFIASSADSSPLFAFER